MYRKSNIIGYKTLAEGGRTYVNFIWGKVCARNKDAILRDPMIKGSIQTLVVHRRLLPVQMILHILFCVPVLIDYEAS